MAHATRWGIFGASKIAHDFLVAMKTLPEDEHKLIGVAARSLDRALEFADKHNIEKAYGSYVELAQDDSVEIIYVSTIHPQHSTLCKLALNHGKHVLCEKPMTMNFKDTNELFELAKSKGLFIMEAMWTRFFPIYADIKNLIDSNTLGEIRVATISFGVNAEFNNRMQEPDLGGGGLLDIGIYGLHVADMIFNGEEPISIHAVGHKTDKGVDSTVNITMLYQGRRIACLTISMAAQLTNEATFAGSHGSLTIHSPFHAATHFTSPAGTEEHLLPKPGMPTNFQNSTGMRYEIQEVRESLLSGYTESPIMPHKTTERIFKWMDEIRQQIGVVYKEDML